MDVNSFANHSLIICPAESKNLFLSFRQSDPLKDFSLLTIEELEDLFAYGYDDRALVYLLRKGHGYSLAKDELRWLSRLRGSSFASPKLRHLAAWRDELVEQGFLYAAVAPERTLARQIYVYGYADATRLSNLIDPFPDMNVLYLQGTSNAVSHRVVYSYEDLPTELRRLFNEICHDIESGVKPDDVYIFGADSSYYGPLQDFAKAYGLAVELPSEGRLYDRPIYRRFRDLFSMRPLPEALELLGTEFSSDPDYETIYRFAKLFAGVRENSLSLYDEIARSSTPSSVKLANAIHLQTTYYPPAHGHLYLLNCGLGTYPKSYADDDFLSDLEKKEAGFPTSADRNHQSLAELSALLENPAVAYLSYKEKDQGKIAFPAAFIADLGYEVIKNAEPAYEYSHYRGAFYLSSLLDKKRKYLYEDCSLAFLASSQKCLTYDTFSAIFAPFSSVDPSKPRAYSYSTLKTFVECPFHYYVDQVLRVDESEPGFKASLGNVFHAVLEQIFNQDFSFDSAWEKAIRQENLVHPFSPREAALLSADKKLCHAAVSFHLEHYQGMEEPRVYTEKAFSAVLPDHPLITLKGRIDALIETGKEGYLTLIDYKTTDSQYFQRPLLRYGFSLQLPFYGLACSLLPETKDHPLLGLFIADVLPSQPDVSFGASGDKAAKEVFPLRGVFLAEPSALHTLDNQYLESTYIKGLKFNPSTGFACRSLENKPALSKEELNAIAEQAKKILLDSDEAIRQGQFPIVPKYLKNKIDSCTYCPYRDICFRKNDAYQDLALIEGTEEEPTDE